MNGTGFQFLGSQFSPKGGMMKAREGDGPHGHSVSLARPPRPGVYRHAGGPPAGPLARHGNGGGTG